MTTFYFAGCADLQALKARYRELAKAHHPDLHPEEGDEVMKAINAEYDELVRRLSHVSADGRTEATAEQAQNAADMATAYREAVYKIIHLDGIEIELCGAWLWVGGDTYKHRDALKAAGYRWANKNTCGTGARKKPPAVIPAAVKTWTTSAPSTAASASPALTATRWLSDRGFQSARPADALQSPGNG